MSRLGSRADAGTIRRRVPSGRHRQDTGCVLSELAVDRDRRHHVRPARYEDQRGRIRAAATFGAGRAGRRLSADPYGRPGRVWHPRRVRRRDRAVAHGRTRTGARGVRIARAGDAAVGRSRLLRRRPVAHRCGRPEPTWCGGSARTRRRCEPMDGQQDRASSTRAIRRPPHQGAPARAHRDRATASGDRSTTSTRRGRSGVRIAGDQARPAAERAGGRTGQRWDSNRTTDEIDPSSQSHTGTKLSSPHLGGSRAWNASTDILHRRRPRQLDGPPCTEPPTAPPARTKPLRAVDRIPTGRAPPAATSGSFAARRTRRHSPPGRLAAALQAHAG